MENFKEVEVFFRTRSHCTVEVPEKFKKKEEIENFVLDNLIDKIYEFGMQNGFEFEFENLEIVEK